MGKIIPIHYRIRFSVSLKCDCRESNEPLLYIATRRHWATLRSKKIDRKKGKTISISILQFEYAAGYAMLGGSDGW